MRFICTFMNDWARNAFYHADNLLPPLDIAGSLCVYCSVSKVYDYKGVEWRMSRERDGCERANGSGVEMKWKLWKGREA